MRTIVIASASALLLLGSTANALVIGDQYYVGSVTDGIPSSPGNEVTYINALIDLAPGAGNTACAGTEICNRVGSTLVGLPDVTGTGSAKDDTSPSTTVDATGFAYILGKYDAGQAGSLVWYIVGLGSVTLPETFNGHELSHWSLYNCVAPCTPPPPPPPPTVPEPGTLSLFGSALIAFGLLRRRRKSDGSDAVH